MRRKLLNLVVLLLLPNARAGSRGWSETRIGRCVLFLGIIWSIAGVWLILLWGIPTLFSEAMVLGLLPTDFVVNTHLAEEAARRCGGSVTAPADALVTADAAELQRARHAAFRMGMDFGMAAGVAYLGVGGQPELVATTLQEVRREAMGLGVPVPELPGSRNVVSAAIDFADDLSADRQCTAAQLESRYSPLHGHTYRFGVIVGYAAIYCTSDVCGAYGPHIRHYGQAAGVPEYLWLPIARGSLADVQGANPREKTFRLLAMLDEYMETSR